LCGLNEFQAINERCGRHIGDSVLVEAGRRLSRAVGGRDTVASLGDDEFAVLPTGLTEDDAQDLIARVHAVLGAPIRVGNRIIRVGASFGIGWARR
jgi:diguanylate cyclase (GGDEF)-like protein